MSFYKEVPGRKTTLESTLKFDTTPTSGSTNPVTSDGISTAITEAVGGASDALQEQIDDIAEKAGSGYTPKGPASVSTLNSLTGQENGWLYTMTDAGTLTDGSVAVVAGDTVAWDATNSVWYKAMDYAPAQYGTNEVHNLSTTATEADFVAGNYLAIDGIAGTKKLPAERLNSNLLMISSTTTYASFDDLPVGSMVLVATTLTNAPSSGSVGSCVTIGSKSNPSVRAQLFVGARNATICVRRYHDSSWEDWQYIASKADLSASVADLNVDIDELYALTGTSKNTPSWTTGSYVKGDGTIGSNVALQMSNEISLAKGTAIEFYGRGSSSAGAVSMISKKENGNYIPLVLNTGDSLSRYRYVNTSDESMTIVISCKLLDATNNYLLQDSMPEIAADFFELVFEPSITALSKAIDSKYVNSVGSVASNPNFNISQQFTLKPNHSLIVNIGSGSTAGSVAVLSKYDNGNYVPLVLNTGNAANKYSYKNNTENDILVCVSFLNSDADKNVYIYLGDDVEEKIFLPSLSTYSTLAVIGDSYASGELWKNNVNKGDFYPISWPQVIARMCGITATNYTRGGASTRSFIADTSEYGYAQMMSDAAKDIYFIVLGLNDSSLLGLEYLGDVSDIGTEADTFYGNYSKIVDGIQTHAPDAKIVLFTTPFTGATYNRDAFNEAIDNLATHYSLPCIRLYEDDFFKSSPMFASRPGGHPTIVGYSGMAEAIKRLVEERMLDDMTYFNDFNS